MEIRREIDFLVSDSYQNSSSSFVGLFVQNRVQNRVNFLHILNQKREPESQTSFQILNKPFVSKRRSRNLLVSIERHYEFQSLPWRINNQRISLKSVQNNSILSTQVIRRQSVDLPIQSLSRLRQILNHIKITSKFDMGSFIQVSSPGLRNHFSIKMIEKSNITWESPS